MLNQLQKFSKLSLPIIICLFAFFPVRAQHLANLELTGNNPPGSAQKNKMELKEIISRVSLEYDLQFNFDEGALQGKMIDVDELDKLSGNIDQQLKKILKPFDLKLEKYADKTYLIYPDR